MGNNSAHLWRTLGLKSRMANKDVDSTVTIVRNSGNCAVRCKICKYLLSPLPAFWGQGDWFRYDSAETYTKTRVTTHTEIDVLKWASTCKYYVLTQNGERFLRGAFSCCSDLREVRIASFQTYETVWMNLPFFVGFDIAKIAGRVEVEHLSASNTWIHKVVASF